MDPRANGSPQPSPFRCNRLAPVIQVNSSAVIQIKFSGSLSLIADTCVEECIPEVSPDGKPHAHAQVARVENIVLRLALAADINLLRKLQFGYHQGSRKTNEYRPGTGFHNGKLAKGS